MTGDDVYLNGEWVPRAQAQVSVFDRGFIFGDGIYEVVPTYNRKLFLAERHVTRLQRNLAAVGMVSDRSDADWLALFTEIAQRTSHTDACIYLQVTRGVAARMHAFPQPQPTPTVFMFADAFIRPDATQRASGFAAITMEDFRWLRGDLKSISLIAAVLASERAVQAGALETIFIRDGVITEGASSNVVLARAGVLLSPVVDRRILPGVTLTLLDEIAAQGIPLEFRDISADELQSADEVMVCSSGREIVAITSLDGVPVSNGKPGPLWQKLYQNFNQRLQALAG